MSVFTTWNTLSEHQCFTRIFAFKLFHVSIVYSKSPKYYLLFFTNYIYHKMSTESYGPVRFNWKVEEINLSTSTSYAKNLRIRVLTITSYNSRELFRCVIKFTSKTTARLAISSRRVWKGSNWDWWNQEPLEKLLWESVYASQDQKRLKTHQKSCHAHCADDEPDTDSPVRGLGSHQEVKNQKAQGIDDIPGEL